MATWYRPLLFASIDPEAAEARGVPVRRLGLMFLVVLALTVTGAAQVVGTLLVLSLAITPAAAAQRLSARPLVVAALSVIFAVAAADGGLLASFGASNVKASVFITSISFAIYLTARLAGPAPGPPPALREERRVHSQDGAHARCAPESVGTEMPRSDEPTGQLDKRVPSGLGWPGVLADRSGIARRRPGTPGPPAMTRRRPRADISHRLAPSAAATRREAAPSGRIAHTEGCPESHARTLISRGCGECQSKAGIRPERRSRPWPDARRSCQPGRGAARGDQRRSTRYQFVPALSTAARISYAPRSKVVSSALAVRAGSRRPRRCIRAPAGPSCNRCPARWARARLRRPS